MDSRVWASLFLIEQLELIQFNQLNMKNARRRKHFVERLDPLYSFAFVKFKLNTDKFASLRKTDVMGSSDFKLPSWKDTIATALGTNGNCTAFKCSASVRQMSESSLIYLCPAFRT